MRAIDVADGYYTVPAGKLVNAVTWFEMRAPPPNRMPTDVELVPVTPAEADLCREPLRRDRHALAVEQRFRVRARLDPPRASTFPSDTYFARLEQRSIGIVAFDGRRRADVEITWFGLTPAATGRNLGRRVMAAALALAWSTCARSGLAAHLQFRPSGRHALLQRLRFRALCDGFRDHGRPAARPGNCRAMLLRMCLSSSSDRPRFDLTVTAHLEPRVVRATGFKRYQPSSVPA